jgi:hypothetical protein
MRILISIGIVWGAFVAGIYPLCQIIGTVKYLLLPPDMQAVIAYYAMLGRDRAPRRLAYHIKVIVLWGVILAAIIAVIILWLGSYAVSAFLGLGFCFIVCLKKMTVQSIIAEMGADPNIILEYVRDRVRHMESDEEDEQ